MSPEPQAERVRPRSGRPLLPHAKRGRTPRRRGGGSALPYAQGEGGLGWGPCPCGNAMPWATPRLPGRPGSERRLPWQDAPLAARSLAGPEKRHPKPTPAALRPVAPPRLPPLASPRHPVSPRHPDEVVILTRRIPVSGRIPLPSDGRLHASTRLRPPEPPATPPPQGCRLQAGFPAWRRGWAARCRPAPPRGGCRVRLRRIRPGLSTPGG